jgi:hypothetical protein
LTQNDHQSVVQLMHVLAHSKLPAGIPPMAVTQSWQWRNNAQIK